MLGVEVQRGVHRPHPRAPAAAAVQQMQEMPGDAVVVGLDVDARPLCASGASRAASSRAGHQPVGDVARAGGVVVVLLGQHAAERGDAGAHHVHRMRGAGIVSQRRPAPRRAGRAARCSLRLVGGELGAVRQLAVHQQVGDLLELAGLGDVEDVVAAIVQVVAGAPDRAQRGVAGGDTGQARPISSAC